MSDLFEPLTDTPFTRRRENTRSRLVHASLGVFAAKGIDGATIDDLVSAAGFTRGAFYSSFSKKEEVFDALFESVTDEVIRTVETAAGAAIARHEDSGDALDDGAEMIAVFEAIRPFGRQWCLLYAEAVTMALRSLETLTQLNAQRRLLQEAIAGQLRRGMAAKGERCVIEVDSLAQLLIGIFVDLMVQEHLDGEDVSAIAGESIIRVLHAFSEPAEPAG